MIRGRIIPDLLDASCGVLTMSCTYGRGWVAADDESASSNKCRIERCMIPRHKGESEKKTIHRKGEGEFRAEGDVYKASTATLHSPDVWRLYSIEA